MPRRRQNDTTYTIKITTPHGSVDEIEYLDNLKEIANILNNKYFSGFEVVTRSMISNWIHYPDKPRRDYADAFDITLRRVEVCNQ